MTTSVSSSASSHTQIMTPPCQGSAENSVRQGMGGFYVNVTNSGQRGWVGMLFGCGGNWGPWYLGEPLWLCLSALYLGLPSPAVGHCWWCFSSQLAQNQEIVCPEGSWNHLAGRFKKKKKKICTPLLLFCRGKWHSGSLKMPNKPLWANASQASQLALRTSSLKSMAQVLQRLAGECECQRPSQQSLLHVLPWTWGQRWDTDMKAAGTGEQPLRWPDSLSCFIFLFAKSSCNDDQESSHREIIWQTFLTTKVRSFWGEER